MGCSASTQKGTQQDGAASRPQTLPSKTNSMNPPASVSASASASAAAPVEAPSPAPSPMAQAVPTPSPQPTPVTAPQPTPTPAPQPTPAPAPAPELPPIAAAPAPVPATKPEPDQTPAAAIPEQPPADTKAEDGAAPLPEIKESTKPPLERGPSMITRPIDPSTGMKRVASTLEVVKETMRNEWAPEYEVENFKAPQDNLDTVTERQTSVSIPLCLEEKTYMRKTKILCTMGPQCWSEEGIASLLDAGMDIARLNFSHGDHEAHGAVFDRFKKVAEEKGGHAAILLDTKGPEIRTAMLKDHQPIELEANQPIIVEAVGDRYTEFEGYKNDEETRIGLSYGNLCQSVVPGNTILLSDGTLSIRVDEILNETELKGTVMNSKKLGERKNGNLPGVKVDIPVLTDKDINDLQNFGCKKGVDFIAASFVQSKEDVLFIRKVLDEAGGNHIQIISKIENEEGLKNFDEILEVTDGIMVARGDLGMEIPSEKVPIAQKHMITKCNVKGKFVVCATQMLESMIENPRPTRAEMTDVANAVYDGVDAVMLSGESANGAFPAVAVGTMASIVANAEMGVDYTSQYSFIRYWNTMANTVDLSEEESACSAASKIAASFTTPPSTDHKIPHNCIVVVQTEDGVHADLVSKYRPAFPVCVASPNEQVLRTARAKFGQVPIKVPMSEGPSAVAAKCLKMLSKQGYDFKRGVRAIFVGQDDDTKAPKIRIIKVSEGGELGARPSSAMHPFGTTDLGEGIISCKRSTNTSLKLISTPLDVPRCTNIICTMGPKCWDEDMMGKLLDAGMDVIRLNFSHGSHEAHQEVLDRFRKVAKAKGEERKAAHSLDGELQWACLLDTKGPEIRTAMLRNHEAIQLDAGQEIFIHAVGDQYTEFEGYKTADETVIGLSYAKLCTSVETGNTILLADGTISIEIVSIESETVVKGRVNNSAKLGERKNGNLPGIKVDLPVLTDKDINDLVAFGCKNQVDYVAASFVQSKEDVMFIRKVLDENGGEDISIISKIENAEGLKNIDEILEYTDGIMVARGDLGMEIPSHKVPFAQKMLITKCNLKGKMVITATQMLESMIQNPRPTRAEMTDVANAVLDGTDSVMLSGETANGGFPEAAVATMAAICQNAEQMVDGGKRYNFLHDYTPKPVSDAEAVCGAAVQCAIDMGAKAIVVLTTTGRSAQLVAKYKPGMPIFVCSKYPHVAKQSRTLFGTHGVYNPSNITKVAESISSVQAYSKMLGNEIKDGDQIVFITRRPQNNPNDKQRLLFRTAIVGDPTGAVVLPESKYPGDRTIFYRSTKVGLDTILDTTKYKSAIRKTKILCTMGPKCWSEEMLAKLLDAGMNIARFNFSHGSHEAHQEVLDRYRKVLQEKNSHAACLLDTKGPEIRTAMLKDHQPIELEANQPIIVEAVGDRYTEFEGYKTDEETRIGLSYDKLCQSVVPGNTILLADGVICIRVEEILNETELRGTVMNSKKLGERKNCNLPGVKVDIPVLTDKDINDLQNFCCKNKMDFVAASFVQSKEDVLFIRKVLDEAGGQAVKIISKIENQEGLKNYDEILEVTDGIMVARGDLGMEIPVEKVTLAQKYCITRANIAGRFVICATQMLESMIENFSPTRAEMTDVANAVCDGVDAVMLSGETANGSFPEQAVDTMARICRSAEIGVNYYQAYNFIRGFTPKPIGTVEAMVSTMAKSSNDMKPGMLLVFSEGGELARMVAKYRPAVPVLVVTSNQELARRCQVMFGLYTMILDKPVTSMKTIKDNVHDALIYARDSGLCSPGKEVVVCYTSRVADMSQSSEAAERHMYITSCPGSLDMSKLGEMASRHQEGAIDTSKTLSLRSTVIDLPMLFESSKPVRKTKIIASLGSASNTEEKIAELLDAGMDVARFNMALTAMEDIKGMVTMVRKVAAEKNTTCAILVDTRGPEIRTGYVVDGPETRNSVDSIKLTKGDKVVLVSHDTGSTAPFHAWKTDSETRIPVNYSAFTSNIVPGTMILIADGTIEMEITEVNGAEATAVALNDAVLKSWKSCNILGVKLNMPVLTSKDRSDLEMAVAMEVDFIAASFVQSKADVEYIRDQLSELGGSDIEVVAKIETVSALEELDDIMQESDGVMIARGDLGTFITPEKVFLAQNMITTKANIAGKFVILARHCLESMITNPRPTRAEMTDVANAVLDGVHCVMLSGETAIGSFPVQSVETMAAIVRNAESATSYDTQHNFIRDVTAKPFSTEEGVAAAAAQSPLDGSAKLVIVITETGNMADLVAKFKSSVPIFVVTTDAKVAACSKITFGQYPCLLEELGSRANIKDLVKNIMERARAAGLYTSGSVTLVHGANEPDSEIEPTFNQISEEELKAL